MAANIPLTQLILNDGMPGAVNPIYGVPRGGFDATEWNFCTTDDTAKTDNPPYPVGTKIMAYTDNSNCPGWYTMIYLALHDFSSKDIEAKCVSAGTAICSIVDNVNCGTHTTFTGADSTISPWYFVTRCTTGNSDVTEGAPICFPCCSMQADSSVVLTTGSPSALGYGHGWGWFWCGGVCPVKDITFFDHSSGGHGGTTPYTGADLSVDDALMRAGPLMACISSDGVLLQSTDLSNWADSTIGGNADASFKVGLECAWACCSEGA